MANRLAAKTPVRGETTAGRFRRSAGTSPHPRHIERHDHFPAKPTGKMKPSALFEQTVEQQVARKPAGKNPLDDREGPDILGNWFLHHEKNEKQEPQDPPRNPT